MVQRTRSLERSLKREPVKREHFFAFMQELFDNNHAEVAPPLTMDEECWYLPVFGIYHPKKQGQIRCVFDSSATFEGVSLISELLSGPQLTKSLLGVLVRFRKERIGIMTDIQKMFYSFTVRDDHRNYLSFLWYREKKLRRTSLNTACGFMCLGTNHHHPLQTMHYTKLRKWHHLHMEMT